MQSPVPTANPIYVDDDGAIAQNLECIGCGYNLRGLAAGVECPECGELVRESFAGRGFLRADAQWLRQMAVGLLVLTVTLIISIFVFILAWPGVLTGCLMFTVPTEQVLMHETCNHRRMIARMVALASTGVLGISVLMLVMIGGGMFPLVWLMWLSAIFCTWIAMYRYAAEIARRFAEPGLMKSSRRMTVASAIVLGMTPLASAGLWVIAEFDLDIEPLVVLLVIMMIVGAIGAFVILLLTLGLIETFRGQMSRAAEQFDWQRPAPAAALAEAPVAPVSPVAPVAPVDRPPEQA